jgi:hypothetical protein
MTVGAFKDLVCDAAGSYIDCNKVAVIVQHAATWSGVSPQSCTDGSGNMVGSTGSSDELISKYAGGASEVVLVTLCYKWDLAKNFEFLQLGTGSNGSGPAMIQASTAFKSEPFD